MTEEITIKEVRLKQTNADTPLLDKLQVKGAKILQLLQQENGKQLEGPIFSKTSAYLELIFGKFNQVE